MTRLVLLVAVVLLGCGDPKLGGPCKVTCDCQLSTAPIKCAGAGEWACNAQSTCEYSCTSACSGGVSTCPADESCNGTICTARTGCK